MMLERRYVIAAVLLHVALFLFLIISAHFNHKMEPPAVIQAVFVQSPQGKMQSKEIQDQQVQEEIKQQQLAQQKKVEQQQKLAQQQQKLEQQQQKQAQEQQQKLEQQKQAQEQQQKIALEQKQAQQKIELEKQKLAQEQKEKALEQQRLLKKQQDDLAKALLQEQQQQMDQEAKELAAQKAAKLKQDQAIEQKRIADMRAQLDSENQARLAAAKRLRQQTWVDKIAAAVLSHWIRPLDSPDTFQCKLQVQLLPGGNVVSAKVVESCGNPGLDDSVVRAVLKTDPMPLPDNPDDFDRNLTFKFQPNSN